MYECMCEWRIEMAREKSFRCGREELNGNESNVIKMKIRMWSDNVDLCRTRYDKMLLMNEAKNKFRRLRDEGSGGESKQEKVLQGVIITISQKDVQHEHTRDSLA